jgi:hypothetical protein
MKRALKWFAIGLAGLVGFIFVGLIAIGTASDIGIIPATVVQTGDELPQKQYEQLRDAKILNRNEIVKFYYGDSGFKITDGGSIMTDQRILGYWTEGEDPQIIAYPLEALSRMDTISEGGGLEDAEYEVFQRGDEENSLLLFLSVLEDGHLDMVAALEKQISENQSRWTETGAKTVDE